MAAPAPVRHPEVRHPDELLADLDPAQREAVTTDAAPLAVLAGAGAGKTRVLTRRIAWQARTGAIDAEHVLAVTFTRKAAGELTSRLAALGVGGGVTAGTIHSIALAQLRRRCARGRAHPARRARPQGADPHAPRRRARRGGPRRGRRARLRDRVGEGAARDARRLRRRGHPLITRAVASGRRGRRPVRALRAREEVAAGSSTSTTSSGDAPTSSPDDTAFAASQRWRFRHLFVDEFQDVSPAQLRLLRGWLGDRPDLCVVGDPDQAIYAFAGAESGILTRFGHQFRGGHVVTLDRNYRSTPQIVGAAEALLADADRVGRLAAP